MNCEVKHDLKKLDHLVKSMSKNYVLKIGILGSKTNRKGESDVDNAAIGAVHEFGSYSANIPKRSFLRMPLFMKSEAIIDNVRKNSFMDVYKGEFKKVFNKIGVACIRAIDEAFETSGFGTWEKLQANTIKRKIGNNPQPLINTEQLRKHVSFVVEEV